MTLNQLKKKLIRWTDFYGGELLDHDAIKKCRSKKKCLEIINGYKRFLELQHIDACTHLDNFIKEIE